MLLLQQARDDCFVHGDFPGPPILLGPDLAFETLDTGGTPGVLVLQHLACFPLLDEQVLCLHPCLHLCLCLSPLVLDPGAGLLPHPLHLLDEVVGLVFLLLEGQPLLPHSDLGLMGGPHSVHLPCGCGCIATPCVSRMGQLSSKLVLCGLQHLLCTPHLLLVRVPRVERRLEQRLGLLCAERGVPEAAFQALSPPDGGFCLSPLLIPLSPESSHLFRASLCGLCSAPCLSPDLLQLGLVLGMQLGKRLHRHRLHRLNLPLLPRLETPHLGPEHLGHLVHKQRACHRTTHLAPPPPPLLLPLSSLPPSAPPKRPSVVRRGTLWVGGLAPSSSLLSSSWR